MIQKRKQWREFFSSLLTSRRSMTVKHIRKNYQSAPSQPASGTPGAVGSVPPSPPQMQRPNPGQMMAQMPKMTQSGGSSNKSWVFGIVLILVLIAAMWYFMSSKKKGNASYFY